MQKLAAVVSLVVSAFLLTSCGNTGVPDMATAPTSLTTSVESAAFEVTPATIVAQPTTTFSFCPAVQPFTAAINLSVRAGSVRLAVTEIQLRFTDTSGMQAPQVTLPAPVPTTQFGSALVQARSTGMFPLALGLGCSTGHRGTLTVIVITRDDRGRVDTGQVIAVVR